MEVRQHIGILLIFIMIAYFVYVVNRDWENGHKAYIPLGAGVFMWIIGEAFYWVFVLMIL